MIKFILYFEKKPVPLRLLCHDWSLFRLM